jgi:hypothetical protein
MKIPQSIGVVPVYHKGIVSVMQVLFTLDAWKVMGERNRFCWCAKQDFSKKVSETKTLYNPLNV